MTGHLAPPTAARQFDGWAAHFDEFSSSYDEVAFAGAGLSHLAANEVAAVLGALAPLTPGRVLDAGAGTGRFSRALGEAGWRVTGLDLSAGMVQRLRRRFGATVVQGRLGDPLPFADGVFDAAVSMRVLKYVADQETAIAELARVVRLGGILVTEWANARSAARWGYARGAVTFSSPDGLLALHERAGLEILDTVAGPRLPHVVWRTASRDNSRDRLVRAERLVGRLLGGVRGARSIVVVARHSTCRP